MQEYVEYLIHRTGGFVKEIFEEILGEIGLYWG
jgi:hypothetical protein